MKIMIKQNERIGDLEDGVKLHMQVMQVSHCIATLIGMEELGESVIDIISNNSPDLTRVLTAEDRVNESDYITFEYSMLPDVELYLVLETAFGKITLDDVFDFEPIMGQNLEGQINSETVYQ